MTIASEITRLQNDKAAMCAAIENKGVTVGNVTFDDYASCIDAIQGGGKSIEFLMMAGGGGGGGSCCYSNKCEGGGGGGAGGVVSGDFVIVGDSLCVVIGNGGTGGAVGNSGCNGGDSCIIDNCTLKFKKANGGGGGGTVQTAGNAGGSGGGAGGYNVGNTYISGGGTCGNPGEMGSSGGPIVGNTCYCVMVGGGGGGATSSGSTNGGFCCYKCGCQVSPGYGGMGLEGCRGGKAICYAGGGGGGSKYCSACKRGCGLSGGGNGGVNHGTDGNGYNATTCGSGGGGAGYKSFAPGMGGNGAGGLVIIGYNCVCKECNGFTCATGGDSCYVCDNMKYHCFTSNGTFTIVS